MKQNNGTSCTKRVVNLPPKAATGLFLSVVCMRRLPRCAHIDRCKSPTVIGSDGAWIDFPSRIRLNVNPEIELHDPGTGLKQGASMPHPLLVGWILKQ